MKKKLYTYISESKVSKTGLIDISTKDWQLCSLSFNLPFIFLMNLLIIWNAHQKFPERKETKTKAYSIINYIERQKQQIVTLENQVFQSIKND